MRNEYISFIEDIDEAIAKRFGIIELHFKIIGYAALALAGLPERGTKDIDTLKHEIKTETITSSEEQKIINFLVAEFGKNSPGELRHGLYLDLVEENIAWLPPKPRFISEEDFSCIKLLRLHPTDTCVSKTFSMYKESYSRSNDRKDVLDALEANIVDFNEYVRRVDETLNKYQEDAKAPQAYPRVHKFITEELIPEYGSGDIALTYSLPSWMENM